MKQTQILILTVPHGKAHEQLAITLKKALEKIRPDVITEAVNALDHCSQWFRAYYNSYQLPLKYWPEFWEWVEGYQHTHTSTGPAWLYRRAAKQLAPLFRSVRPKVVVATEVGMCELAALTKRHERMNFSLAAVPTGIDTDRPWIQPEVNLHVVEPHQAAPFLRAQGVPNSRILACGVPVDPCFGSVTNRHAVCESLGLTPALPLLLILFGGSGIGKPLRIIEGLKNVQTRFQAVWIAGTNQGLRQQLERQLANHDHSRVIGWTDRMHEWMAAADLLLSKPGSGTLLEAMNSGLPVLAFDPLPGIERRACDLIEAWQIGRWIKRPEKLAETIDDFLSHPEKLQRLRANALNRVRPGTARTAAQAILGLLPSHDGNHDPRRTPGKVSRP